MSDQLHALIIAVIGTPVLALLYTERVAKRISQSSWWPAAVVGWVLIAAPTVSAWMRLLIP